MLTALCHRLGLAPALIASGLALLSLSAPAQTPARTVQDNDLRTWWHAEGEKNDRTPVADGNVRQSRLYEVSVATAQRPDRKFDAFTYLAIPRSGLGKAGYRDEDGAEFAAQARMTMSWTSFLYAQDTWVEVRTQGGFELKSADEVTIRPTRLAWKKELVDPRTVRILVPYSEAGQRFSVEFAPDLVTSYNDMSGTSGRLTTLEGPGRRAIHTEPRNALMIFADPLRGAASWEPEVAGRKVHYPPPGVVKDLDKVDAEIIYFRPGVYSMPADTHGKMSAHAQWVYLAPGAYVKGTLQFPAAQRKLRVTGLGVLSSEKYPYETDRVNGYRHKAASAPNCHRTCVKLLEFEAGPDGQDLELHGVTLANPSYHSFVAYGNEDAFRMQVSHTKLVGSWYWQTDGLEVYNGGTMEHVFFHANDDVLKAYHSDIVMRDVLVWKGENGPVIQFGWIPRNIHNIRIDGVDVIHNRMYWKDVKLNTCLVNASSDWKNMSSNRTADTGMTIADVVLENIRSEGLNPCAIRLYALSNYKNIEIRGLSIDGWNELDAASLVSHFKAYHDTEGNPVRFDGVALKISNFSVGGQRVTDPQAGRMRFDRGLVPHWSLQ